MLRNCLENVRRKAPMVHCITNYVTANDVANVLLGCGASPVMADAPEEAAEITSRCDGLTINMGTLNQQKLLAMRSAGKQANQKGNIVVLDPVGVGASGFRMEAARQLLKEMKFDAIRGNLSEITALAAGCRTSRGVDAQQTDMMTEESMGAVWELANTFAKETGSIIIVSGAIDVVCDGKNGYAIRNGRREMRNVTGTGCQLSGLLTAYLAANRTCKSEAAVAAVCAMGVAGEIAWERLQEGEGNATYRNRIIDAINRMDSKILNARAKVEEL